MLRTLIRSSLLVLAAAGITAAVSAEVKQPAATAGTGANLATATFASGCFWCTESDFDSVDGVVETVSGYTGGKTKNPTYEQVGRGATGHTEALQIKYDPVRVSYQKLLDFYWRHVDLLDGGGQFCDRGSQYRPAIFVHDEEQKRLAEASKAALDKSGRFDRPIAVQIVAASEFTPAEDYHQNYHATNPLKYRYYRHGCGRDQRVRQLWGDEAGH